MKKSINYSILDYSNIAQYIWVGQRYKNWYKDCTDILIEIFGDKNLDLVSSLIAATSINTSLKSNITLFKKAYTEFKEGREFSNYLPIIKTQLEQIRSGKGLTGRKISSFAKSLAGDKNAVVVDLWMLRAFGIDKKRGATKREYDTIEAYITEQAHIMGLHPCELQAIIWVGIRKIQTGSVDNSFEYMLRYNFNNLFSNII